MFCFLFYWCLIDAFIWYHINHSTLNWVVIESVLYISAIFNFNRHNFSRMWCLCYMQHLHAAILLEVKKMEKVSAEFWFGLSLELQIRWHIILLCTDMCKTYIQFLWVCTNSFFEIHTFNTETRSEVSAPVLPLFGKDQNLVLVMSSKQNRSVILT